MDTYVGIAGIFDDSCSGIVLRRHVIAAQRHEHHDDELWSLRCCLSGLYPVDFDSDGVYELLGYQKIAGRYNADSLGYILNTLRWKDNMFVLDNQYLAIFGADIQ